MHGPVALTFPLLLWLGGPLSTGLLLGRRVHRGAFTIVWTTTFSIGSFGDPVFPVDDRVFGAQAGILAFHRALVLAALFAEAANEAALMEGEARLQEALRLAV